MRLAMTALLCIAFAGTVSLATPQATASDATVAERIATRVFTELEKELVGDYYRPRSSGKSAKGEKGGGPDRLPPGLQKQLDRNGRLPPGLEKKRLPDDLAQRLPPRAAGIDRVIVGTDVLLVEVASQAILDIIRDVVRE